MSAVPGRSEAAPGRACELCEAARMTARYYEDDLCWIAECEQCCVPMVVWRTHDPVPPAAVRERLLERLTMVVRRERFSGFEDFWVDDHMRSIPGHFHAHARPRRRPFS